MFISPSFTNMEDSVVKSNDILLKDNLIRNLKKKLHQNQTKNKRSITESMFALNCMGNCFHRLTLFSFGANFEPGERLQAPRSL
jgi:hypothetical protein